MIQPTASNSDGRSNCISGGSNIIKLSSNSSKIKVSPYITKLSENNSLRSNLTSRVGGSSLSNYDKKSSIVKLNLKDNNIGNEELRSSLNKESTVVDGYTYRTRRVDNSPIAARGILNSNTEAVKSITGSYSSDYNIIHIHNLILSKLQLDHEEKSKHLQFEIQQEKYKIGKPQTVVKRRQSIRFIKEKENQLEEIKDKKLIDSYINQSKTIIERYRSLGVYQEKRNSDGEIIYSCDDDDNIQKIRLELISKYLQIASKYIYVNVHRKMEYINCCLQCGTDLSDIFNSHDGDTGVGWCPMCGLEKINFSIISSFDGVSLTNKNYNERENFHKSLLRKQGKLGNRLPDNLFILLDAHFASFPDLPDARVIRSEKPDEDGKKPGTSKRMIYDALASINMTGHYEDGDLICREYWGWVLPDLSHLEDQVMSDYDETQNIYKQLPRDGQSNINREYRLFKHLQMRGFKCKPEDFRMIGTRDIIERYDDVWEKMIKGADNNNPEAGFVFIRTL